MELSGFVDCRGTAIEGVTVQMLQSLFAASVVFASMAVAQRPERLLLTQLPTDHAACEALG
jgi:hypothetical protein